MLAEEEKTVFVTEKFSFFVTGKLLFCDRKNTFCVWEEIVLCANAGSVSYAIYANPPAHQH